MVFNLFKAATPLRNKIFFNTSSLKIKAKIVYLNNKYEISVLLTFFGTIMLINGVVEFGVSEPIFLL